MVLSIDACMRCGGLTKRFLKHRYDVSLVKHMTIVVLSRQVPSIGNEVVDRAMLVNLVSWVS